MKKNFFYIPYIAGSRFIDATNQAVIIEHYNPNYMTITGTAVTNRKGTYNITISLRDPIGCEWENGSTDPITLTWVVNSMQAPQISGIMVLPVPNIKGSLVVNGSEQSVIIENLNNDYMDVTGTTKATNVGRYTVTVSLKFPSDSKWSDGTANPITLQWEIIRKKVSIPRQYGVLYYTGEEQRPEWTNYDPNVVVFDTRKGTYSGINAQTYNITASLKSNQYIWENNSTEDQIIKWEIKRQPLNISPTFVGDSFYFSGKEQGPLIVDFDSNTMKLTGTAKAINVGTYTVYITPKSNYCWKYDQDNEPETDRKQFRWKIVAVKIQKPTLQDNELIYNGQVQGPANIYDNKSMAWSGTSSAINAGTYQATVRLLDNYVWDDGTTDPFTFFWTIKPRKIESLPFADKIAYNGMVQSPEWHNVDDVVYNIYGDTSAILPGVYFVGFTPTNNYSWVDGSRTSKKIPWRIIAKTDDVTYSLLNNLTTTFGGAANYARIAV